jgi:hypothetical protein
VALWCQDNNLSLNVSKTKALIHINRTAAERVCSFKFFCVHITEDLTWTNNTPTLVKRSNSASTS